MNMDMASVTTAFEAAQTFYKVAEIFRKAAYKTVEAAEIFRKAAYIFYRAFYITLNRNESTTSNKTALEPVLLATHKAVEAVEAVETFRKTFDNTALKVALIAAHKAIEAAEAVHKVVETIHEITKVKVKKHTLEFDLKFSDSTHAHKTAEDALKAAEAAEVTDAYKTRKIYCNALKVARKANDEAEHARYILDCCKASIRISETEDRLLKDAICSLKDEIRLLED